VLKEPTKMKASPIAILWQYWRDKMLNGDEGLEFINAHPEDTLPPKEKCKGKKKAEYVDLEQDSNSDNSQGSS
jgi:hypothetical protein